MAIMPDAHLTTHQSALYLNERVPNLYLSSNDIRKLIHSKEFPDAYKERNNWYVPQTNLDDFLQKFPDSQQIVAVNARKKWEMMSGRSCIFWPLLFISALFAILAVIYGLISAGADFGAAQDQLYKWGIVHRFPPRHDDEILIVITTFYTGTGDPNSDLQDALYSAVSEQINTFNLSNTRVQIDKTVIPAHDRDQARQRGQYHDANIIIWGDDTDFHVQTNFLNLSPPCDCSLNDKSLDETERTALADPNEYVEFVNKDLKSEVTFLALFAIGDTEVGQNNEIAIELLTNCIDELAKMPSSESDSISSHIWFRLGVAYADEKKYLQAIDSYTESLAFGPVASSYQNRGVNYAQQSNWTAAIADFTEALKLTPENTDLYLLRGLTYIEHGDWPAAIADFSEILTRNPEDVYAYIDRSNAYYLNANFPAAVADLNQALILDPNNMEALYERAELYAYLGDGKSAVADYQRLLKLYPDFPARNEIEERINARYYWYLDKN